MRRALLLACLGLLAAAGPASAATRTLHVTVPLDRTGAVPGTVKLKVAVHRHSSLRSRGLVVALAGGPGQAGAAWAETFAEDLGKAGKAYDVAAYDPRGTGKSGRIDCPEVERQPFPGVPSTVAKCAARLGRRTGLYTTQAAAEDLEAVRAALKVDKVVVYGTSYGTRVAMAYAAAHPAHVARMVLDSTTPATGVDPLLRSTWAAVPRILRALCAKHACEGITKDPVADLRAVLRRLGPKGSVGPVWRPGFKRVRWRLTATKLIDLLYAGDFDFVLRSRMPAALHAGARGDLAPLRKIALEQPGETLDPGSGDSDGLYYATNCEESPFPWSRTASPAVRRRQAHALLAALPASTWGPFSLADALVESDLPSCAAWPQRPAAPPALAGPLPDVPVLIFSGGTDMRTPTEDARKVAAAFPRSTLVVDPTAGHSVLEGEGCDDADLQAWLAGRRLPACRDAFPGIDNEPAWPRSLATSPRYPGVPGVRGRIVGAVERSLSGMAWLLFDEILASFDNDTRSTTVRAGLHGGEWRFRGSCLRLVRYSVVPGVRASGRWCDERAWKLRVDAGPGRRGTIVFSHFGHVRGTIGGRRIAGYRKEDGFLFWSSLVSQARRATVARLRRHDHAVAPLRR